eukprot:8976826-Heterocapsa_arctica.AAC.1
MQKLHPDNKNGNTVRKALNESINIKEKGPGYKFSFLLWETLADNLSSTGRLKEGIETLLKEKRVDTTHKFG